MTAEGLGFAPVRPGFAEFAAAGLDEAAVVRGMLNEGDAVWLIRKLLMPWLEQSYEDAYAATEGADFVFCGLLAYGAKLAALKRGLPWMSFVLQPGVFFSGYDVPTGPQMRVLRGITNVLGPRAASGAMHLFKRATHHWAREELRLRHRLGIPLPRGHTVWDASYSPFGTLGLYSPLLGKVQPDFPPQTEIVGFAAYDSERGGAQTLSPELETFLGTDAPPLVFTLGSVLVHAGERFYDESADAARRLKMRAVLLTGDAVNASRLASDDVFVCRYAPHSQLFPRAAAIIHHGGIGTLSQGLRSGRPQLIVPFWADQPDNAARAIRLGVAAQVPHARYDAQRTSEVLRDLLQSHGVRARAAQAANLMRHEDGAAHAADIILNRLHARRR